MIYTKDQLAEVLDEHQRWVFGGGGECANLMDADLRCANLRGANLMDANLRGANLMDANLRCANLRGADLMDANLMDADLRCANLRGANLMAALMDANLWGADLRGADLWGCSGDRRYIKSLFLSEVYPITYTADYLQIGCQRHKISAWWSFNDKRIIKMGGKGALAFWRDCKDTIKMIIEKFPAKPTRQEKPHE